MRRRIVSYEGLESAIGLEYRWRASELGDLLQAIKKSDAVYKRALIRAGHPLIYAHLEGFFKRSTEHFINFAMVKRAVHAELPLGMAVHRFRKRLNQMQTQKVGSAGFEIALSNVFSDFKKPCRPNDIDIEIGNLNSDKMRDLSRIVGIDFCSFFDLDFIDEKIVATRNHIAHGENILLSENEIIERAKFVRESMNSYKNILLESASNDYEVTP